jgi:hypothetical protein
MAITVNGMDGNPFTTRDMDATANNFVTTRHKLGFTGNYAAGGDALDLTAIAGLVPSGSLPLAVTESYQGTAAVPSLSAAGGFYQVIQAASPALNNYKLKVFKNTAGSTTEYGAGAYATDVTTDNVFLEITWRKLL